MGLRTKLYLLILPLVLVVVLLSGILSVISSRAAIIPVATRLMAYKAEQLRDFAHSEWETIATLGLQEDASFRLAAEESFRSYASSLLRSDSELIVVFDAENRVAMEVGVRIDRALGPPDELLQARDDLPAGWFIGDLLGQPRVGIVFAFPPYDWTVAVTELQAVFFTDTDEIIRTHIIISIVAVISATLFVWLFVGYLIRPVERLTALILSITETQDLSQRVTIEFADEIGSLAHSFNGMISSLESSYARLETAMEGEKQARRAAVEREEETLLLLGRASDYRDKETGDHLHRISSLAAVLSRLLGESEEKQALIRRSSALHDLGKIAIRDQILLKPGKLSPEEYEQMKKHTIFGHRMLRDSRSAILLDGAEIALNHHEKWDGTGYPNGLAGPEIPLSGRIVGLVDVFDALTSERPYKSAWSPEAALEYMVAQSGTHFDPDLIHLFADNFSIFLEVIAR